MWFMTALFCYAEFLQVLIANLLAEFIFLLSFTLDFFCAVTIHSIVFSNRLQKYELQELKTASLQDRFVALSEINDGLIVSFQTKFFCCKLRLLKVVWFQTRFQIVMNKNHEWVIRDC